MNRIERLRWIRRQGWWEGSRAVTSSFVPLAAALTAVFYLAFREGWLSAGHMWLWVAFDLGLIGAWLYAVKVAHEPEPGGHR